MGCGGRMEEEGQGCERQSSAGEHMTEDQSPFPPPRPAAASPLGSETPCLMHADNATPVVISAWCLGVRAGTALGQGGPKPTSA